MSLNPKVSKKNLLYLILFLYLLFQFIGSYFEVVIKAHIFMVLFIILSFRYSFPTIASFLIIVLLTLLYSLFFDFELIEVFAVLQLQIITAIFSLLVACFALKLEKKYIDGLVYLIAFIGLFHLTTYFGFWGFSNNVLLPNTGEQSVRYVFGIPIVRLGGLGGASIGSLGICYVICIIHICRDIRSWPIATLPLFSILTFLSASVGAFLTLISFLIFQLFFKIKIGAFFIFIIFLFFFGPLISSIELTDHIKVGEYLYSIIFERLSMISFYLPFGGNFDFPVSTVERSGIRDLGILSVFSFYGIFSFVYIGSLSVIFIVHSPKLSLKSLTFFLLPLLIFLHGIVFYYPIIFIFASILAGRWTYELRNNYTCS